MVGDPKTEGGGTDEVYVEATYPDGAVARWVRVADSDEIEQMERALGTPDTLWV
jgi:hypothetical protein